MSGSIGKFAVAFVEYGDTCDGFPGILGVYDTLAEGDISVYATDANGNMEDYNG